MDFVGIDKFSLLDYDGLISIVLFSPGCNFACPYCHNKKSIVDSKDYITFKDIYAYLKSRKNLIDAVTFSGGEPTLMRELKERIKLVKELGYKIKLDTNGSNPTTLKDLLDEKLLDYVAMDIKSSFDRYDLATASKVNIDNIKQSIDLIKNAQIDYEFRITLVDEFVSVNDIEKIAKYLKGSKKFYLQKYVYRDDMDNKNLHPVSEDKANEFKEILSKYIAKVELRGY